MFFTSYFIDVNTLYLFLNWFSTCVSNDQFQTKICDFPYRISALEPGAWPERVTSCYDMYMVVGVNIKREMVLLPNDEVANSYKKHYPIQD